LIIADNGIPGPGTYDPNIPEELKAPSFGIGERFKVKKGYSSPTFFFLFTKVKHALYLSF
jgi:hypothetical protein